jgi:hypothetical protein
MRTISLAGTKRAKTRTAYSKFGTRKCGSLDGPFYFKKIVFFSLHQKIKLIDMKFRYGEIM